MSLERRATRRSTTEKIVALEPVDIMSEINKTLNKVNENVTLNPKGLLLDVGGLVSVVDSTNGTKIEGNGAVKSHLNGDGHVDEESNGVVGDDEDDGAPEPKMAKLEDSVELDDQSNQSLEVKPKGRKEKNMHQCPECDKRFLKKGILTKHLKSHSQLRPFICDTDDCEKSFVNARALEKHVKSVHQGEDVMLHLCQFCQKAFITRAEMDAHAETHLADYKMYACRFCGKTFNKKFSMKIAVQASHDKPPEPCPFCNKLINSKAYTDN